jgi:hypothetical protein
MASLFLHGQPIDSVFELLGNQENDITYSIGWTLAKSDAFLRVFLKRFFPNPPDIKNAKILLQEFKRDSGITDIEIQGDDFHVIVEAKRGWTLPNEAQLSLYTGRFSKDTHLNRNCIVVMSECSPEYASLHLATDPLKPPIRYCSWKEVVQLTRQVRTASHSEKRMLEQLRTYLGRIVSMQNQESNKVYVVSLAKGTAEGCSISWIDIVKEKRRYFHPVGKGWPASPPNYIGFRYDGILQAIHHVESWKIVDDLHQEIPEIGSGLWNSPYYLYTLGPVIQPTKVVKTGKKWKNLRVWAMLDLLLTCGTIAEARDLTNKRLAGES